MTTTAQTSVLIRLQGLVNHPCIIMHHIFILNLVHQGKWWKHKEWWRKGQERRKDRELMLIRSYRYTTGMVASVDPCHNSSLGFDCFPQRDLGFYSLSTNLSRCNQMSITSTLIFPQGVQTAVFVLEVCAPSSIRATYRSKHKDRSRSDLPRSDQIRSDLFPMRLISILACFWIETSLLFSVWSQSS